MRASFILRRTARVVAILAAIAGLYIAVVLIHGTIYDWKPEPRIKLEIGGTASLGSQKVAIDSSLTFVTWNVGYGGLGSESTFFYDDNRNFFSGDKMVRAPEALVAKNVRGMCETAHSINADFVLLQEVDLHSRRSYYTDEMKALAATLSGYTSTTAVNFNVRRVPLPIAEPWNCIGEVYSGLGTFAKYTPTDAVRLQLPSQFGWPNRIFHLDRCLAVHRFATNREGKELVVVNLHNSAYDHTGELKKQEMSYLKDLLLKEYEHGNYVICGGDWNQCPPNFNPGVLHRPIYPEHSNIPPDLLPPDWVFAYDPRLPSNRDLANVYDARKTQTTLIDFFLLSPNVSLLDVHGIDNEFAFSDHQPVAMKVQLK